MTDQFPLECEAHRRGPVHPSAFALEAMKLCPESEDYLLEPTRRGVRIHAASEAALEEPLGLLGDVFGESLAVSSPRVKYREYDGVLYEPIMFVRTRVRPSVQPAIRAALAARGATILEEDPQSGAVVTRAMCALIRLLGATATLRRCAGPDGRLWIWLSHYAPAPPTGEAA